MSPEASVGTVDVTPMTWPSVDDGMPPPRGPSPDDGALNWLVEVDPDAVPTSVAERLATATREAHARGLAEGQELVAREAEARCQAYLARVETALVDLADLRARVLHDAERDLVRFALALASRVVHRDIAADPAGLLTIARHAAGRLGEHIDAVVRLHPDVLAPVEAALDVGGRDRSLRLVADPAVPLGGCLVESAAGSVDAGVDAQFRALAEELLGSARSAGDAAGPPRE